MAWLKKHTVLFLIGLVILISCHPQKGNKDLLLNENELCFTNEKLASISKDGNTYYIGAESSGHIYEYSVDRNTIVKTYNIDCGRVYHVKQSLGSSDTLWVGTQNMGLRKVYKQGDSLKVSRVYTISGKDTRYSCYETYIDTATNRVYAMTSHGIFCVVSHSDRLQPVYVEYEEGDTPEPMVATNMIESGDFLYVSTAKGIVRINKISGEMDSTEILKDKRINNINYHYGSIYALTDNMLFKCSADGLLNDSFPLKRPAKKYYYSNRIHYFVSENYLVLAHDSILQNSEQHKYVPLNKDVAIKGHNIATDSKDFILLVTNKAVLQIGHHLPSVFCEIQEGGAKLACTDGNVIFFLVGKKIYKLEPDSNTAKEVLELKEKGDVRFIECGTDGESLYYVNNHDEIYRCNLVLPWWKFWASNEKYIGKAPKEITSVCSSPSVPGLIVGIRDGLICVNEEGRIDTIALYYNDKDICTIPYISRFAVHESDSSFMVPTMNDGLFYGKGMRLQLLKDTRNLQFIRDIAYSANSAKPFILTNKHVYNVSKDSVLQNKNYSSRLITSGASTYYFPGEVSGVRRIQLDKNGTIVSDSILFPDISFKAESSLSLNDLTYLGGSSGVIMLKENQEKPQWDYVKFVDNKAPNILLILCIAFIVILSLVLYDRYRLSRRALQINKDGLILRIDELKTVNEYLDPSMRLQLENLVHEVERIDVGGKKNAMEKIREVSKRIMEYTESIPSVLTKILQEQMVKIENTHLTDAHVYLDKSREAISIHTLLRLGGQIKTNKEWLENANEILAKYDDYKTRFSGITSIPQVTDKIIDILKSDKEIDTVVKEIDNHLNTLNSNNTISVLKGHWAENIEKAKDIQSCYAEDSDHYLIINEIIGRNEEYLSFIESNNDESMAGTIKNFPITDKRLEIINILKTIQSKVSIYCSRYADYKKLDDKLNSKTAYATCHEDEKARLRKQDEDARKKSKECYKMISTEIKEAIDDFYYKLATSQDQQLIDVLRLEQKKGKGQFMWESVLALLISGTDYNDNTYGMILGNDASRIRDAKGKILKEITCCHSSIADYAEENPSSIALLLLNIDNSRKNKGYDDVAQ